MSSEENYEDAAYDSVLVNGHPYDDTKDFEYSHQSDKKFQVKLESDQVSMLNNNFHCDECGKQCVNERKFKLHMKSHERSPQIFCDKCNLRTHFVNGKSGLILLNSSQVSFPQFFYDYSTVVLETSLLGSAGSLIARRGA